MPFNFSSPEYLSPHKRRKNRVSPVSQASPAHMNSPLPEVSTQKMGENWANLSHCNKKYEINCLM